MSKSIMKNAIYKVLLNVFNLIVPIIIGPYIIRVLNQDQFGRQTYGYTIFSYFFIFASFGIYNYALREVSKIREDKKKLSQLFTSLFVLGLISNILVIAIYLAYSFTFFKGTEMLPILLILTINMVANIFYVEWANEALENFDFITKKTIVVRMVYVVLVLLMVRTSADLLNYVFISTIYTFLNNIVSYFYIVKNIGFDFKNIKLKKHIKYLIMVLIMSNGNILYTQLDRTFLGNYISDASVAVYAAAQGIMTIINTIILSIVFVTVPRLAHILASEGKNNYLRLINKSTKTLMAFLFPTAIGIYVLADEIIFLYGGNEYLGQGLTLKVFAAYMIVIGLDSIMTNQILYVNRKEKFLLTMIFSFGLLNLILKFAILKLGILSESSSIATTAISSFLLVIAEFVYVRKNLKFEFNPFNFENLKYLLFSSSFFIIDWITRRFVTGSLKISIVMMGLCAVAYALLLIITKDEILFELIGKFKSKLKARG